MISVVLLWWFLSGFYWHHSLVYWVGNADLDPNFNQYFTWWWNGPCTLGNLCMLWLILVSDSLVKLRVQHDLLRKCPLLWVAFGVILKCADTVLFCFLKNVLEPCLDEKSDSSISKKKSPIGFWKTALRGNFFLGVFMEILGELIALVLWTWCKTVWRHEHRDILDVDCWHSPVRHPQCLNWRTDDFQNLPVWTPAQGSINESL